MAVLSNYTAYNVADGFASIFAECMYNGVVLALSGSTESAFILLHVSLNSKELSFLLLETV